MAAPQLKLSVVCIVVLTYTRSTVLIIVILLTFPVLSTLPNFALRKGPGRRPMIRVLFLVGSMAVRTRMFLALVTKKGVRGLRKTRRMRTILLFSLCVVVTTWVVPLVVRLTPVRVHPFDGKQLPRTLIMRMVCPSTAPFPRIWSPDWLNGRGLLVWVRMRTVSPCVTVLGSSFGSVLCVDWWFRWDFDFSAMIGLLRGRS